MDNNKGRTVELSTFLSYKKSNVIGYKTIVIREKTLVNFIWCKLCATFKDQLLSSASLKGSARTAALAFINGTNVVAKSQVSEVNLIFIAPHSF